MKSLIPLVLLAAVPAFAADPAPAAPAPAPASIPAAGEALAKQMLDPTRIPPPSRIPRRSWPGPMP
jgi:hypothetical protein